jgi:3-deoxy-manno-octulosonate cytidylyltransferase (CMP-KDO synthetase)
MQKHIANKYQMNFLGIIPARYASTRFPGKPLADLAGKPVIQRVYERVCGSLDRVVVATDDERILHVVEGWGGEAVLTSSGHSSGTDRCLEAYLKLKEDFDVIINIQGDEPFIYPSQIELLKTAFQHPATQIATLVKPFSSNDDFESLLNPNTPKVLLNSKGQAIYFSRSVIPYIRGKHHQEWLKSHVFYKHIGIYAYKPQVLSVITSLPPSLLEKAESLEQLRWIENGYAIQTMITDKETFGIDTPEDLEKAVRFLVTSDG